MHDHSVILGDIPLGKAFFLRIENALLLGNSGDIFEILSDYNHLENELIAWCRLKGETFLDKIPLPHCFAYRIKKSSANTFLPYNDKLDSIAPKECGLIARGASMQEASPNYHFHLSVRDEVWASNLKRLYEDTKNAQWNATSDIKWNEIPEYSPSLQFAMAQIMTYLVENECLALYVPSLFLPHISPYYYEVPLLLSSIIGDEARHIEAFIKRAKATGLGLQYSTITTQQSLYTLYKERDYLVSSFLLHIMGEGTFIDLLGFLESYFPDDVSKKLLFLARKDESRHTAYGLEHIKITLKNHPEKINLLKNAVFARKAYLDELSGESSLLLESLAILAGGGDSPAQYRRGFEAMEDLKQKMQINRTKRLVECGIDEELANDMSKAHTPNFM